LGKKDWEENPEFKKIMKSNWWYIAGGTLLAIGLALSLATGTIPFK